MDRHARGNALVRFDVKYFPARDPRVREPNQTAGARGEQLAAVARLTPSQKQQEMKGKSENFTPKNNKRICFGLWRNAGYRILQGW